MENRSPITKIPIPRPKVWAKLFKEKIVVRISGGLISPSIAKEIAIKPERKNTPITKRIAKTPMSILFVAVNTNE